MAEGSILYLGKFVVFKFQPVTHIDAKGKQCDGHFRDHTGFVIFDIGIIAPDIHNCTEHNCLLVKTAPGKPGAVNSLSVRN